MRLQLCTWREVEAYLERSTGIIVPIGSTEQHGPNGLLGTDAICPEAIALAAGDRLRVLVAPTLPVGMAQHHMGFPGTLSLRPATLIAMVRDVVASLARHGFRRVYFLNGHGGNTASLNAAFSEVYGEYPPGTEGDAPPPRCRLANWWNGTRVGALSRELFGAAEGSHATPSEVSLSYYVHPEAVKAVTDEERGMAGSGPILDAADFRRRFPDGRIGSDPSLATVEAGGRLLHAAVDDVVDDFERFVNAP